MQLNPHDPSWPEHIAQVRHVAYQLRRRLPPHVEVEDLVQAGMIGLLDAFQKFDRSRRVQFRSYAQFRIWGAMIDSLRDLDWSPRELRRQARSIDATKQALGSRLGREPNDEETAKELGFALADYQHLLGEIAGLDVGVLQDRVSTMDPTDLAIDPADTPDRSCERSQMQRRLVAAMDRLPAREREVLSLYYRDELNMREIAQRMGVVESRISQIHSSAIAHLRVAMGSRLHTGRA